MSIKGIEFNEKELTRNKSTTVSAVNSQKKGFYDMEDQIEFMTNVLKIQRLVRKWLVRTRRRLPLKADKARKL